MPTSQEVDFPNFFIPGELYKFTIGKYNTRTFVMRVDIAMPGRVFGVDPDQSFRKCEMTTFEDVVLITPEGKELCFDNEVLKAKALVEKSGYIVTELPRAGSTWTKGASKVFVIALIELAKMKEPRQVIYAIGDSPFMMPLPKFVTEYKPAVEEEPF